MLLAGIVLLVSGWCSVALAQSETPSTPRPPALTPAEAFRRAIYGEGSSPFNPTPDGICPRINGVPRSQRSAALQDLVERCNGAVSQQPELIQQLASEEIATQATGSIEASTKNIGTRLAAARAGITGINLQRFSLGLDNQPFTPLPPPTLVASLLPFAAVGSAIPAKSEGIFRRLGIFVNGNFAFGDKDPTRNESGFEFTSAGVTVGADYRLTDNFILGVALNYQATDHDLDDTLTINQQTLSSVPGGGIDTQIFNVSLYGTFYIQKFYIDSIITLGWSDYDIRRIIRYDNQHNGAGETVPVDQVATANTDGNQFSFSFGLGYDFTLGGLTVGPYARINYLIVNIDGYRESIDNTDPGFGWALAFRDQDADSLLSVIGAQASYAISTGFGVILPQVRFEWNHEFANDRRTITANFVADPERQPIRFTTDAPDRNFLVLGAGLAVTLPHGWSAFGDYEALLALEDFSRHAFTVGVRKEL